MDIFEQMQKDFDEFYAKAQDFIKNQKIRNKELELLRKQNDLLQEENLDYRYDITDIACERATEMARDWEEQYKYEIAVLEKALELACRELNDCKKRHMPSYNFTETDEMNAFKLLAKEIMKSE